MKSNDERLAEALENAERNGRCLRSRNARSRRILRRRVAQGTLVAVRDDLFARKEYWDDLVFGERIMHILRSVAAAHPDWVLGQISAAAVWGLNETYRMHDAVHIATDRRTHRRNSRYFVFHELPEFEIAIVKGIRVTGLLQTVFDCARMLPFPQALAICDAAMRLHGLRRDELEAFIGRRAGSKGIAAARLVAAHADGRSENGGESIVRARLIQWGYAVPLLQQWITDPVTGRRYRVDFLWILPNGEMIVLELDGREKYTNPAMLGDGDVVDALLAEKERESNMRLRGNIRFVRASFMEFEHDQLLVRRKLDLAGVPLA